MSSTLEEAEVQPTEPGAPIAYAMPEQVAEAIVRLEAHNLQVDEELANAQRESLAMQKETLEMQQQMVEMQRATLTAQQAIAEAMARIANRLDVLAVDRPAPTTDLVAHPTARTGLPVQRVNECLRLLRKHACIHARGGTEDGTPVYVLKRS